MRKIVLKYIGTGAFLPGVPKRDLTADDLATYGLDRNRLVASGLYEKPKAKKKKSAPPENKMKQGGREDKEK
jgi:hypothetical protein